MAKIIFLIFIDILRQFFKKLSKKGDFLSFWENYLRILNEKS